MLPILRIIPVGGVLLAMLIVVLALAPPGGTHPVMTSMVPARGALIAVDEHPEWRQFLIQAAFRRADELGRLRELPDTPTRIERPAQSSTDADQVAGLPANRADSDPDEVTGTISETPSVSIPLDIGETSTFELPVAVPEEKLPAVKPPQRKAPSESRKTAPRTRHAKPAPKPQAQAPALLNPFAAIFGGDQRHQQPGPQSAPQPAVGGADQY